MNNKPDLDFLLKSKKISQRTYDRVKVAKEYIENKYNLKSVLSTKWSNIIQKIQDLNINEAEKQKLLNEINQKEAQKIRKSREKQTIREYESIKIIGRGAFGEVHVCREIKTGKIYAVKKIKKDVLLQKNQVIHIRSEQQFMSKVKSPWIVDLKASFQEDEYLYLVMEYCQGGDFMSLLIKKDILSEDEARFYIAELILAVDSIHKLDCIHRDIKPDNILIDKNGHIKLSDFGLAKISPYLMTSTSINNKNNTNQRPTHQKNYSCVGTAYYVAPEVLKKTGYSKDIDWWSVGVIFFEMLVGYAPFCSEETKDVCNKVINWKKFLKIPGDIHISSQAEDLIMKMINNSDVRLGKNGVEEIKAHPFFKKVDWDNIRNTRAPFIPELKNDYDTKYFEDFKYEEDFYPKQKKFKKRKDIEFFGYTYKEGDELCKDVYDEEDEINEIYKELLLNYQINNINNKIVNNINNNEDKKENNNNNSMQLVPHDKIKNNNNNIIKLNNSINNNNKAINSDSINPLWNKNKNIVYVKNKNKVKYSPKNINKNGSPILYNKINLNKNKIQNQLELKPPKLLKMIKIENKKNPGINLYLAKSARSSKNKYTKVKLSQNNNLTSKNKIRVSPTVVKKKMLGISLNNSQNKIKIQNIKKENSMKNIKDNNLNQNQALKV